jgi:ribosome-binding protein aMBF1 (putative translation factor)
LCVTSVLRYASVPTRPRRALTKTLDTSRHDRRLARRLKEDAEFRAEFERQRREIAQIDAVVRQLDELRKEAGMSKAELARAIGKEPSSIRRFFTADVNPELKTVAAVADVLGAKVEVVASGASRTKRAGKKRSPHRAAA